MGSESSARVNLRFERMAQSWLATRGHMQQHRRNGMIAPVAWVYGFEGLTFIEVLYFSQPIMIADVYS